MPSLSQFRSTSVSISEPKLKHSTHQIASRRKDLNTVPYSMRLQWTLYMGSLMRYTHLVGLYDSGSWRSSSALTARIMITAEYVLLCSIQMVNVYLEAHPTWWRCTGGSLADASTPFLCPGAKSLTWPWLHPNWWVVIIRHRVYTTGTSLFVERALCVQVTVSRWLANALLFSILRVQFANGVVFPLPLQSLIWWFTELTTMYITIVHCWKYKKVHMSHSLLIVLDWSEFQSDECIHVCAGPHSESFVLWILGCRVV